MLVINREKRNLQPSATAVNPLLRSDVTVKSLLPSDAQIYPHWGAKQDSNFFPLWGRYFYLSRKGEFKEKGWLPSKFGGIFGGMSQVYN
jgi:hypothetical protein